MSTIFLTGISGCLGRNLATSLPEAGFSVIALVRNKTKYKGPFHPNLQLVEGELMDDHTQYLNECDTIIHAAALTEQHHPGYRIYHEVNYLTTVHLVEEAIRCGVGHFVFISSANTMGYGSKANPGREEEPIRHPFTHAAYAMSKLEAEKYLLAMKSKIKINILNPGFLLGAYVTKHGSGRLIRHGWPARIIFYPPGGKSFVHVADVAKGVIACLEFGTNGERYLLVNENLSYRDFYLCLNRLAQQKPFMVRIPALILQLFGGAGSLLRCLNIKTNLSVANTRALCIENFYSNAKSVCELGISYQSTEKAIQDSVEYFRKNPT